MSIENSLKINKKGGEPAKETPKKVDLEVGEAKTPKHITYNKADTFEERLIPPFENQETTKNKLEYLELLFNGELEDIDTKNRPTILDFHTLPSNFKEDDILKWIKKEMGIDPSLILEDGKSEESKTIYNKINYSYQIGKEFLKNALKYSESDVSVGPSVISSKKDIFDLLHGTMLSKGNNNGKSMLYCRIVKAIIIANESFKKDVLKINDNTKKFEESLISSPLKDENTPLTLLDTKDHSKKFYASENGDIKGNITLRGKDPQKVMLKFLTRPESNSKTAFKDGIAARITIEDNGALELIPQICKWLKENMKVKNMIIENQSFIDEDQLEELESIIKKEKVLSSTDFNIINDKPNNTSMGNFESLKIIGVLNFNRDEKIHKHARQFEIQFVKPFNKNEKGKLDHNIYDVSKFVTARTRLDGLCPENVFLEFVKDAHINSGMSEETIIDHLVCKDDSPIIKTKRKNGKFAYVANSVYSRWRNFGWIDASLIKNIDYAKSKKSR